MYLKNIESSLLEECITANELAQNVVMISPLRVFNFSRKTSATSVSLSDGHRTLIMTLRVSSA